MGRDRLRRIVTRAEGPAAQSERVLRQQNRYLESLLEISPTAIVTLGLDGRITSWNLAAEALFGYTAEEAIGCGLEDLVANQEDLRAEYFAYFDELKRGERFHAVTRRSRKDGTLVDVDLFAVPVTAEDELTGYLVIYYDISALKAAEKRYRDLIEHLPLVTYIDEPAAAPSIYISPQVEPLVGYSADEWLGDPDLFLKLLHPEDRERVLAGPRSGLRGRRLELVVRVPGRRSRRTNGLAARRRRRRQGCLGHPAVCPGLPHGHHEAQESRGSASRERRALSRNVRGGAHWYCVGPARSVGVSESAAQPIRASTPETARIRRCSGTPRTNSPRCTSPSTPIPTISQRCCSCTESSSPAERERYELAMRYLGKDGRVIWAQVVEVALQDEQGGSRLGLTMVQDITARKLADEALRKSEAELRRQKRYLEALLELSPAAVVTTDLDDSVTVWNAAAQDLFGYTPGEALGRNIDDLIAKSDQLHAEAVDVNRRVADGQVKLVTRRTRKDGTLADVDLRAAPILVGGEMVGSYAIYHDLSDVHRQKQYFESLLEISPTAIVTVDLADMVTSWNPAAEKLFGYTREEAVGRNVDQLIAASPDLRAEARKSTAEAPRTNTG